MPGIAALIPLAVGLPVANHYWPFRYRNVEPLLDRVFASQVKIEHYRRVYFPHPGFVAQGITLRRNSAPDLPPVGSADDVLVEGDWTDLLLLRRRVALVEVTGMHVVIPPVGSRANQEDFPPGSSSDFAGPETEVETLHLIDATLDLMRDAGARLRYPIHDLTMHHLQRGHTATYAVDMGNAQPSGRIQASGNFGPLLPQNLGGTQVSGRYTFSAVRLSDIGALRGTLAAQGQFRGALDSVELDASSRTPDFAVGGGAPVVVDGTAQATVNGLDGNVVLHRIELRTGSSRVDASGSVMGSPKVVEMDVSVSQGEVEDLLRPFLKDPPPIAGVVSLEGHAHIDPAVGGARFLQRLHAAASFQVPAERIVNAQKERELTAFSERAQGGTETTAQASAAGGAQTLASVRGALLVQNGVVQTRQFELKIPGASVELGGTFDLRHGAARLIGHLTMAADLSHATTGWRSMMLKPLAPLFRKRPAGAVVPIAITGSDGRYKMGQDLLHDK